MRLVNRNITLTEQTQIFMWWLALVRDPESKKSALRRFFCDLQILIKIYHPEFGVKTRFKLATLTLAKLYSTNSVSLVFTIYQIAQIRLNLLQLIDYFEKYLYVTPIFLPKTSPLYPHSGCQ
ncbi:hypothetical protein XBJ2_480016 [Xenorhabdus bovienii str. Jollieti]|nr:hypothetical protein XBJ2_480016 [Xenorhabdus bovienii str. Jollieti]